ncbi:MAG: DUF1080 domain-containing protein [Planctomycetaceae bacterium]
MVLSRISLLSLLAVLLLCGWSARGWAEPDPATEPGFRPLFNGRDLTGWHKNPERIGHGTGGLWTVVDGVIEGEQDPPGSGNGGILLTDETFGDFEVVFELRPDWGPDSGFFLRSTPKGNCYQIMLDYHEDGNVGEIYREGLDGASNRTFDLFGVYADTERKDLKTLVAKPRPRDKPASGTGEPRFPLVDWNRIWRLGEWNTIRSRVKGNPPQITTWINGALITEYQSDKAFTGVLESRGHLALQVHGGQGAWPKGTRVRFRNIRVRELP